MLDVADLLRIEATFPRMSHAKWAAIKVLTPSTVRYARDLNRMLTHPGLLSEALALDPTTTNRLLRQREQRANARKDRTR